MKHLEYEPETPRILSKLGSATVSTADAREYLQLCYEFGREVAACNILQFPYSQVNPYTEVFNWIKAANYELGSTVISTDDLQLLEHYAGIPSKEIHSMFQRSSYLDRQFEHEYLQSVSQICVVNELLSSLHVYNFYVQNYIHESLRARQAIISDHKAHQAKLLSNHLRHRVYNQVAEGRYDQWVRDPFTKAAIRSGSTRFNKAVDHLFHNSYPHCYPIIKAEDRNYVVQTYEANLALANKLKHYQYYQWIRPTKDESDTIHGIRNYSYIPPDFFLFNKGSEHLTHAVKLAGKVNGHILGT